MRFEPVTAGGVLVDVYSQAVNGLPESSVGTLNGPNVIAKDDYVMTPSSEIVLLADTTYWLVFRSDSGLSHRYFEGDFPDADNHTTDTGAVLFDFAFSPDSGATWQPHSGFNLINIQARTAAPIPEPSIAMFGFS